MTHPQLNNLNINNLHKSALELNIGNRIIKRRYNTKPILSIYKAHGEQKKTNIDLKIRINTEKCFTFFISFQIKYTLAKLLNTVAPLLANQTFWINMTLVMVICVVALISTALSSTPNKIEFFLKSNSHDIFNSKISVVLVLRLPSEIRKLVSQ